MNTYLNSLDIIFRQIHPEYLLCAIRGVTLDTQQGRNYPDLSAQRIGRTEFIRFAQQNRGGFSTDELENIYNIVQRHMHIVGWDVNQQHNYILPNSIFYLLTNYTEQILRIEAEEPVCCSRGLLDWRYISFCLGQDLLTTAHLALHDKQYFTKRTYFAWAPVIHTDDIRTRDLMRRGVSENHFHLGGSSRSFSLSWVCLMNHPEKIYSYFRQNSIQKHFSENLDSRLLLSSKDYQLTWPERIQYACWLRVILFRRVNGFSANMNLIDEFLRFDTILSKTQELRELVCLERFLRGEKFSQPDRTAVCLDYAITTELLKDYDKRNNNFNRILVGERVLLYRCFYACFSGEFNNQEQDLFYLYLLLRAQFRGELIQINHRVGFRNFADYQDRKRDFYSDMPEYCMEAYRLAINGSMKDSGIRSLEARMGPEVTVRRQLHTLEEIDKAVLFAHKEKQISRKKVIKKGRKLKHFYVLHFSKQKWRLQQRYDHLLIKYPRNYNVRKKAKIQALALARALSDKQYACDRIRGIDAASFEIGCRPETFATEFRFLREFEPIRNKRYLFESEVILRPRLSATYHAGEDFLDIADGLRAIDEAILFLHLKRGDRIGHALALGVSPETHYSLKQQQILTTKQDRLDDLVWILFRTEEWGISVFAPLRLSMEREANQLFKEIYRDFLHENPDVSLLDYYECWKLRGNHPDLYRCLNDKESRIPLAGYLSLDDQYKMHKENKWVEKNRFKNTDELLQCYHFGQKERERGMEATSIAVTLPYIALMRELQDYMQHVLVEKGISVECNPSSNVLIGTFGSYEKHPIFRLNQFGLDSNISNQNQLSVSINTDDQSIFDTSLENEYALLACSLMKQKNADGTPKYSDDAVYCYLNHIREMSNLQIFPSARDTI